MTNSEMVYRPLGRCGMKVSAFSLGGWTTFGDSVRDKQTIREILYAAFNAGINYFDISDVYNGSSRAQTRISSRRGGG